MLFIELAVAVMMVTFIGQSMFLLLNGTLSKDVKKASLLAMACVIVMLVLGILLAFGQGVPFSHIVNMLYSKFTWMILFLVGTFAEIIFDKRIMETLLS